MELKTKTDRFLKANKIDYNIKETKRWFDYNFRIWKGQEMPIPKPPAWFAHWNKGFDQWKDKVDSRLESLETKVDNNSEAIQRLETKVDENSKNIKKILGCPTIQQEIQ